MTWSRQSGEDTRRAANACGTAPRSRRRVPRPGTMRDDGANGRMVASVFRARRRSPLFPHRDGGRRPTRRPPMNTYAGRFVQVLVRIPSVEAASDAPAARATNAGNRKASGVTHTFDEGKGNGATQAEPAQRGTRIGHADAGPQRTRTGRR